LRTNSRIVPRIVRPGPKVGEGFKIVWTTGDYLALGGRFNLNNCKAGIM
jgi:hypothetical protein